MDIPIHIHTISVGLPILHFIGAQVEVLNWGARQKIPGQNIPCQFLAIMPFLTPWMFGCFVLNSLNCDVFLSLNVAIILANIEVTHEMQQYASFHLSLPRLSEYPFRGFKYVKKAV